MELINKAKELFDTATVKTGDFIYDQKCNLQIARVCADLKKQYERLGRLCFRKIKGLKIDDNEFDSVVEKVEVLKLELSALRENKVEAPEFDSIVFENGESVEAPADGE